MVAPLVRVMRIRGLHFVAAVLVAAGVFLIATDGDQGMARGVLVAGLLYAVTDLVIEWRNRQRACFGSRSVQVRVLPR